MSTQLKLKKAHLRRKRARKKHPFDYEAFREKHHIGPVLHLINDEYGEIKMSEVLLDFADPILDPEGSNQNFERGLSLAAIAWNIATAPPSDRADSYQFAVDAFNKSIVLPYETVRVKLDELIERKLRYFSHICRFIVNYEMVGEGEYRRLFANSVPLETQDD